MDQMPEVETMLERFWDRYSKLGPMEALPTLPEPYLFCYMATRAGASASAL